MDATKIPGYLKVLLLLTVANLLILAIRNLIVGDVVFNYLLLNLSSSVVPFIIAVLLLVFSHRLNNFFFIVGSLLWLLHYPNAPYMISDLIHSHQEVHDSSENWIIHDTLMIFSLAVLSVFYGFVSLKIMFNLFRARFGNRFAHTAVFISVLLSCVALVIGRLKSEIHMGNGNVYSSEMYTEPVFIIKAIWHALVPIKDHLPEYFKMFLFGFVQYQLLVMMKDISDLEGVQPVTKKAVGMINSQSNTNE
jgi:uncharacterized membrane protein